MAHKEHADAETIEALSELLEQAKRGEINALAAIAVKVTLDDDESRYESTTVGGGFAINRVGIIGALQIMSADIVQEAQEEAAANED